MGVHMAQDTVLRDVAPDAAAGTLMQAHRVPRSPRLSCSQTRTTCWLGHPLVCADGVTAGPITGVLVDETDGEALYVVVCFGSVSRMGEDSRVIPVALLSQDGDAFAVPLPLEAVRRAPIFVSGTCCADGAWWERVARHFRDAAA